MRDVARRWRGIIYGLFGVVIALSASPWCRGAEGGARSPEGGVIRFGAPGWRSPMDLKPSWYVDPDVQSMARQASRGPASGSGEGAVQTGWPRDFIHLGRKSAPDSSDASVSDSFRRRLGY